MIKTEQEIERDFYIMIEGSRLGKAIRGDIYRADMRPANATTEDLVVKLLEGADEKPKSVPFEQSGTIIINIYVPAMLYTEGRKVRDNKRISELQKLISEFICSHPSREYLIASSGKPMSTYVESIQQYVISARIAFDRYRQIERFTAKINELAINTQLEHF